MKKYSIPILFSLAIAFQSCNDSFLDRLPTTDLNDGLYWNSEDDLKAYANGIYNQAGNNGDYMFFLGFTNTAFGSATHAVVPIESQTDNHGSRASEHETFIRRAAGQQTIPNDAGQGGWLWPFLRVCNVMLANYQNVPIAESIRNQYAGEALFFRAWFYLDKVQNFGDVPYVSTPLNTDSPQLFDKRTPRKQVMDSVLRDINLAIEYLPTSWTNGAGRITKYTALALKSRLALYEGTYRKYHGLGDAENYLRESLDASEKLMASNVYKIYNTGKPKADYRSLFINPELASNPEIIMARNYVKGILTHNMSGYVQTQNAGPTRDFVDDFLCIESDGSAKPIGLSSIYNDATIENVFNNRDARLAQIVLDPREEQVIFRSNVGYPRLLGMGGDISATGYHLIKYFDYDQRQLATNSDTDAPIFRYAEILLNYAEAKAELGTLSQTDLDRSINLLRDRAGVPRLQLNPPMDPKYAGEGISSNLVEIRRERRIELCYEQIRFQDLMRWKKGSYLAKKVLGIRFEDSDRNSPRFAKVSSSVKTVEVGGKKYIDVYAGSDFVNRVFDEDKHYLMPLPINVLSKNPALGQNPKW
ncbi:RagB/SusD family nutrient uptake outer membrane protein [Sphingobacterium sp.]|uniref:RagB/SusD family nutrient uptake outer membrane protein n=1 Tax=Sphingobacterium sp. TaxID=341027 RepID=UPI0028ACCC84|nr:RagB/SusD family nutrient uptake outer membrane protein [Sphingobacterium sp.]